MGVKIVLFGIYNMRKRNTLNLFRTQVYQVMNPFLQIGINREKKRLIQLQNMKTMLFSVKNTKVIV